MHPDFRLELIHERAHQLEQALGRSRVAPAQGRQAAPDEAVSLRLCSVRDDAAVERLAQLGGRAVPEGRFVLAEVGGEVVAALPLLGGDPLTDPFRPTAHLLPLLRLRAGQLENQPRARIERAKAIAAKVLHPAR